MWPVHTVATVTAGLRCPPLMLAVIYTAGNAVLEHFRHSHFMACLRHYREVSSPTGNRQAEPIRPSSILRGRGAAVEGKHQYSKHLRHDSDSKFQ